MKTPMQELLTAIRLKKYVETNEQAWEAYDYVVDIAKSMLEKEKNVIVDAHIEGQRVFDDHPHTQWTTDQAELYYEKTFNAR